jgi:hypothetical protein
MKIEINVKKFSDSLPEDFCWVIGLNSDADQEYMQFHPLNWNSEKGHYEFWDHSRDELMLFTHWSELPYIPIEK